MRSVATRSCIRVATTLQEKACSNQLRFSTAAVDSGERSSDEMHAEKVIDVRFPWKRKATETEIDFSLPDYITHHACKSLVHEVHFNYDSIIGPGAYYMEVDFICGAKQAFQTAVTAIFNNQKIRAENEENKAVSDNNDLTELFDAKLAHFYENAIDLSYKLNHKVFHNVEMVRTPTIVNYDILYGAKRDIDLTGLVKKKWMGVLPFLAPIEKSAANFGEFMDQRFGTVRITLNIPTKETFYVVDTTTDRVIQGSKQPAVNYHMVLFETVIDPSVDEYEWKICDIDDWLEGNEFWQPTRIKNNYGKKY